MPENPVIRIDDVVNRVTKDGSEFPRAIFAAQLVDMGLNSSDQWIEYAKKIVLDSRNVEGRTLVLLRAKKEMPRSPALLIARGRGGKLAESYVQPHIENKECLYERLALIEGRASLIKLDDKGELINAIPITEDLIEIKPGEAHTIVFETPLVVLFEEKEVRPDLDKLFVPGFVPEGSDEVPKLLEKWHDFADNFKNK